MLFKKVFNEEYGFYIKKLKSLAIKCKNNYQDLLRDL